MSDDGESTELREELSIYDDGFPRPDPNWDETSIVTPRAFLCEYGYDLPGDRIPEQLARHLLTTESAVHTISLIRLFDTAPEQWREQDTPADAASMLSKNGYNAVEVYRIDADGDGEFKMDGYASGGFIVKYSNIMAEDELKRTGHSDMGYYWVDNHGRSELLKKLLNDPHVYGEEAESRRSYLKRDWEEKPNPAEGETWRVLRLNDIEMGSSHLTDLARENLLYPGVEDVYDHADDASTATA